MTPILAPPLKFPSFANSITVSNNALAAPLTAAYNLVTKYLPGAINFGGNYVRLIVLGPSLGSYTLSNTYIGLTTTGSIPSQTGATRITWNNAQNSLTATDARFYVSDLISFTVDDTKALYISYDVATGGQVPYRANLGTNYVSYIKSGGGEAGTATRSGYTPVAGFNYLTAHLQVNGNDES